MYGNMDPLSKSSALSLLGLVYRNARVIREIVTLLSLDVDQNLFELRQDLDTLTLTSEFKLYSDFLRKSKEKYTLLRLIYQLLGHE